MKLKILFMLSLILTGLNIVLAQVDSYDIFTFAPDPKWKRSDYKDNIQFTLQQGNNWVIIGLYKGTGTTGNISSDFQADWNDLVGNNYTVTSEISKDENIAGGLHMITGSATASRQGQSVSINLITFTGPASRNTILISSNDPGNLLENDIATFMGSLSVNSSSEAKSSEINQNQPAGSNNYQPPMTAPGTSIPGTGGFPTPNEQPVTRTAKTEGWLVEATNEYIQYSNSEIKVVQYFYVPPEDPNSNTDDEDLFWRKFLSGYFSADHYNKYPNEPYAFMNRIESASGFAVSKTDGKQYFLVWIVNLNIHCSFLAITGDEANYRKYFSHPNDLAALDKYNYFPVTGDEIQGKWADSGFAGAQMYYTTGGYAGMSVASTAEEWTFSGNQTRYFANGATGTVGALNTFTVEEFGTYQLSGNDLVVQVTRPVAKTHEFWCGLVAGKGGLLLKLANKKFTAQIDFLSRKQ